MAVFDWSGATLMDSWPYHQDQYEKMERSRDDERDATANRVAQGGTPNHCRMRCSKGDAMSYAREVSEIHFSFS